MLNNKLVYIIGFMGSGKSTAGKKLASLLDWSFIDLDKKIENQTGMTIPEIFSRHGENYFREVEAETLKRIGSLNNVVVSTGGGTPCFNDNMDFMTGSGLTIYLKLTPPQLKSRLADSTDERPLLKDLEGDQLLGFINDKLILREEFYKRCEITVDGFDVDIRSLQAIIKEILHI